MLPAGRRCDGIHLDAAGVAEAARIPGIEARLLDHDGHLTLVQSRIGEVHEWLLSRL